MDDICRHFFHAPEGSAQRRYEALRAFFVERRLLRDVARDFGFQYGSLRNLVSEFRRQCQQGTVTPFLSITHADAQAITPWLRHRKHRPSPTADNFPSRQASACAPELPVCSFSCLCWHVLASMAW